MMMPLLLLLLPRARTEAAREGRKVKQ